MDTNNEGITMDTYNLNEDTDMDQPQGLPHHDTAELRESMSPVETSGSVVDVESPEGPGISFPQAPILLATHQTEFNMDALPTRRGRPRRTRDMAEIYVCICGRAVDSEERVMGSDTAVRCAFEGCETSWVRCLN